MQDRFKLRYYDEKSKRMYDVCFIDLDCPFVSVYLSDEELFHIGKRNFKWENLIQCTGLKDKNDKLIYEGDIVKFKTIQNLWAKGKVVFTESCALFEIRYGIDFNNWELMDKYQYEVIGNIYENPDLLEV